MERAKEGVPILLNNVLHSAVVDFECASSRILLIKFNFSKVKVCVVVGYGPNEGDDVERLVELCAERGLCLGNIF